MDIGFTTAFVGGILALLSPCSVMLLPAFFSFAFDRPANLISNVGLFFLGLITTLVPIGVLAASVGALLIEHRSIVTTVISWAIVALGIGSAIGIHLPGRGWSSAPSSPTTTPISVYLLGTVYGIAGGCAGPVLGAVLSLSAMSGNVTKGGLMLAVYAAGMVLPLLLIALLWGTSTRTRALVRPRMVRIGRWSNSLTSVISGSVTAALGVFLLLTDGTVGLGGFIGAERSFRIESWVLTDHWGTLLATASALAVLAGITIAFVRHTRRWAGAAGSTSAKESDDVGS